MRIIVLDTETTGLNPNLGDRVVEIGCVELKRRKLTGRTWHCYLRPNKKMDEKALQIHGLTDEFLQDKPLFAEVCADFLAFIKGAKLVIHNAEFDLKFLDSELTIAEQNEFVPLNNYCEVFDTLALARQLHPNQRNNLDVLCRRYNVDNSKRDKHGALLDAELLAQVYLAMTGGQASLAIGDDNAFSAPKSNAFTANERQNLADLPKTKIIYASTEELTAHEQFLNKMHNKEIKLKTN